MVHGNLNPGSIFLDKDFYPKIGGFNCSAFCDNDTELDKPFGTPFYMAPEILFGEGYSNKVDVFSYSLVLYELVVGKYYLNEKCTTYQLICIYERGRRLKINNINVPHAYEALIKRCWNDDPNKRPSFIQIVKEFIDNKEEFFDSELIDKDELENYIENAIQGLDFSLA